jgi:hypothetical protein
MQSLARYWDRTDWVTRFCVVAILAFPALRYRSLQWLVVDYCLMVAVIVVTWLCRRTIVTNASAVSNAVWTGVGVFVAAYLVLRLLRIPSSVIVHYAFVTYSSFYVTVHVLILSSSRIVIVSHEQDDVVDAEDEG